MPPGLSQIIQSFSNVIATMGNAFVPLLIANLMLNTFTFLIFLLYRQIWVWLPALALWVFTAILYYYFAMKKPHMLSTTVIQRYGMQIEAKLGEKGKKPIDESKMLEIPPTTDPSSSELKEKN